MARSRVKQDPNEVIACSICGASFKRKSQYTHRQSEPCLVARDKARVALLGWSRIRGSEQTRFCDVAGVPWDRFRTDYRPQGWGKSSRVDFWYFCPAWAAAALHVGLGTGLNGGLDLVHVCLALLAFKNDTEAQDGLLATCAAGNTGALALMLAYADQYNQDSPGQIDQIRSKLATNKG